MRKYEEHITDADGVVLDNTFDVSYTRLIELFSSIQFSTKRIFYTYLKIVTKRYVSHHSATGEFSVISSVTTIFMSLQEMAEISTFVNFLFFVHSNFWYLVFLFSLIWVGITSVRFVTIILFATPDIFKYVNPAYGRSALVFDMKKIEADPEGFFAAVEKYYVVSDSTLMENAKNYEILVLLSLTFTLLASALFFADISIFFDPKLSYSTRVISIL